jgi:type 1 glutamine amidotransferase|tara:strand:+ start:131 stop:823 length:693 start_codon:yes stop_codon:yes gene_type:complete
VKLLVITGGRHPYEESTPILENFLKAAGHDVTATEDASVLTDSAGMAAYDALVFNTRRENAADFAEMKLSEGQQNGIINYVKSGKGFVCLHISGCGADYWSEFAEITGGGWVTGTSFHPPYGNVDVKVTQAGHAGVAGVSDFSTEDELYMGIEYKSGNDVFLEATSVEGTWPWGPDRTETHMPGATFPLAWTRGYGQGKVFSLLLGHDGKSFQSPEFQKIVLNGVQWVTA